MTEQPTPIKVERIISPQEQLDYAAKKITSQLPPSLSSNEFIVNMWARIIPPILEAADQETIDRKFGLLITKLDLKSSDTGKEKLLEDLAGLQDMLTDPSYANDVKAQEEIRADINKLETKIDHNQNFFGDDFEKVRDSILEAREKFQNGTLAQEMPEPVPEPIKQEPEVIIEPVVDTQLPSRPIEDNASMIQAEPAENSDDISETSEEVAPDVSQDTPRRRAIIPKSEVVEREEIFDPEIFKNPPIDGAYHFLLEEDLPKQEQAYSVSGNYDKYNDAKLPVPEILADLSTHPTNKANMFRDDYDADSHAEIPDARITLGDMAFSIRDSNKNEITLQSVDDETIIHKIDRKKFEKIREAMQLQASLKGLPKKTLAITDEQKKLKTMLEALFAEDTPTINKEVATPAHEAVEQPEEKIEQESKLDEPNQHPQIIESEKINDRTSLAEAITTGYQQEILDLYNTCTFENVEMIREFNQNKALELVQEITVRYHLPITKITTLEDNIYEMNVTLANGVVLEHVGKITNATTLREKATLVHIAQTVLSALSDDAVAEILAKIKSGAKNTNEPEIILVPYQAANIRGGEVVAEEGVTETVEPEQEPVEEKSEEIAEKSVETPENQKDVLSAQDLFGDLFDDTLTADEELPKKEQAALTKEDLFGDLF